MALEHKIYVLLEYSNYYKIIGLPFRPMTGDYIVDHGITMDVGKIFLNKDLGEIVVRVSIHNVQYSDMESQLTDMVNKGWRKRK